MSQFLYAAGLKAYAWALRLASPFHEKAGKMIAGRKDIFIQIKNTLSGNSAPTAWFHCASLGEFEQGRPVIEAFAAEHPDYKIVLTFFSPSGYEIRKNYTGAHYIFYLPLDSSPNAKRFLDIVKPRLAVFVKYEFWYYYLKELNQRQVPVISISAIFRPEQIFFKAYGGFYLHILKQFTHIFTQNQASAALLEKAGLTQVTVAGDTRFDRVIQTVAIVKNIPVVEAFKNNKPLFVIGSSWPQDIKILLPFIHKKMGQLKFIIAPHEIQPKEIDQMAAQLNGKAIRYSQVDSEHVSDYEVLIIDNIGMLSSLYKYGTYSYIGGAFGKGLHNTLEAAAFGLPLFFGPNYHKFQEAIDLVALQVAFPINSAEELDNRFSEIKDNPEIEKGLNQRAKKYVQESAGATQIILHDINQWLSK